LSFCCLIFILLSKMKKDSAIKNKYGCTKCEDCCCWKRKRFSELERGFSINGKQHFHLIPALNCQCNWSNLGFKVNTTLTRPPIYETHFCQALLLDKKKLFFRFFFFLLSVLKHNFKHEQISKNQMYLLLIGNFHFNEKLIIKLLNFYIWKKRRYFLSFS
jgi:hypothetical protein